MAKLFERRLTPLDSPLAILTTTCAAFLTAMLLTSFLFLRNGAGPLQAYAALFHEPFGTLRGFGYSLVRASPLALVALGTIVSWRSGFAYLGFEGCFVIGAAATAWLALLSAPGAQFGPMPSFLFFPLAILFGFVAAGIWAALVGIVRARFGGNEVLISLMSNYVAIFILQYLVSGPMRAPGSLPETRLLPRATWLPFILPGTRYAGIDVPRRLELAAFFAGGLGGLAGMVEVLGSQHRVMDGISGGMGFVGIVVALLARLNPVAVIPTALLYGGMSVGADAMQRHADIPSSITFILESLAVLLVLAFDALRYYRLNPAFWRSAPPAAAGN
jgi:ABC-type uncharacterized transport system permease subunit